ncbi:hypothetical protein AURDEDRAFT_133525 [Auricularia subglabra TFB-10046 SS5]|nr:hypothetical protein AURDEDRAFT_133525 [Auricularia subglabra TFB-10046 SS5]
MADSPFESLINQAKSPDADVKVEALAKLQAEFEAGAELHDSDALLTTLKTCLRTPNQHVSTAALGAIAPFFPLLVAGSHAPLPSSNSSSSSAMGESATLRHALTAFLASGGVLDRLGDARDKARERARDALVAIASVIFKHGGQPVPPAAAARLQKAPETPLAMFERFVREGAFAHKAWRVREQMILALVQIRKACPGFPLRPFLVPLVETLEDPDGTVRDCSRESIVQIFSSPTVSDAARAELKKEMTKKGVRKTIVESVLARVLAGGTITPQSEAAESDGGQASAIRKGSVIGRTASSSSADVGAATPTTAAPPASKSRPPSRAAAAQALPETPAAAGDESVKPVFIASARDLEGEFAAMTPHFEGKESEHNWAARDQAILKLRGMLKGEVHLRYPDVYLAGLKAGMLDKSVKTLMSLRTTVASNTCSWYSELADAFGTALDPFCETLFYNLLKMSGFTKKIIVIQTQGTVTTLITHTSCHPKVTLPMFGSFMQEKTVQAREYVIQHFRTYLETHAQRAKHQVEATGGLEHIENCVKKGLADANPGVRVKARETFWAYHAVWPERAKTIMNKLDATAQKQLQKACPDPAALASSKLPPVPEPKKTSVAAAIAASRAKAKQIAAAPPTLRHQATSTAHAVRAASPPLRSPSRGGIRAASPVHGSPPSSRGRASPVSMHSRTRSGSGGAANPPPSPPPSPPSPKTARRPSGSASPLASPSQRPSAPRPSPQATQTAPAGAVGTLRSASGPSCNVPGARSLFMQSPHKSTPARPSNDEDLLLATTNPLPLDSDSDGSDPMDAVNFATPYERYGKPPLTPAKSAPTHGESFSSPPAAPAGSLVPEYIVEDAMRARAEQAVSAASQLLELVEPEDDMHVSPIPPSLLLSNGAAMKQSPVLKSLDAVQAGASRQASASPTNGAGSSTAPPRREERRETGWWQTRMTGMSMLAASKASREPEAVQVQQLRDVISQLEQGMADLAALQRLAAICTTNPADPPSPADATTPLSPNGHGPLSPSPLNDISSLARSLKSDIWFGGKMFDKAFSALARFMETDKEENLLEHGLVVLWEMLESQASYIDGNESVIYNLLFRLRYANRLHVLEGTAEIRDLLANRLDPIFGLMTVNAALKAFLAEPLPTDTAEEARPASLAFGLIALAKFIVKLPSEVIEEELPRLKSILITSLNDSSLVVRESATVAIIAAQLVLRDETHLFMLLDGLATDKKNLLTYFFDKHGARGVIEGVTETNGGMERLEKEMRRLDTRMNTPVRPKP